MSGVDQRAEAVRRFNRFYTREIGVLRDGLLESRYSLTEARALFEIARGKLPTAAGLCGELSLDPGYLSRIVKRFEREKLISRTRTESDGRQFVLALTEKGRKEFAELNRRSHNEMRAKLEKLSEEEQQRLVAALETARRLLGGPPPQSEPYLLRQHKPGDMGWVVHRHGVLYSQEYGWDESFEALVAEIVAQFLRRYDARRERCWIAERNGSPAGCVFLVRKTAKVGQLRLLLVEPSARGLGIGKRLVQECLSFARQAGYRKVVLWTNSVLTAARRIYRQAGFSLVEEKKHHSFGADLAGQTWETAL